MRIADELLLLAIHPAGGRPVLGAGRLGPALAGAILADLVLAGRIRLAGGHVRPAVPARVPGPAAPRDPELEDALTRLTGGPGPAPAAAIAALSGAELLLRLRNGLIGQGILAEEEQRVAGVLRSLSHPELNPAPRREILARLDATLAARPPQEPPGRTAALLAVAHACGLARALYPGHPDLDRRAGGVTAATEAAWTARAVAQVIAASPAGTAAVIPAGEAPTSS